jgi:hypothetical protein
MAVGLRCTIINSLQVNDGSPLAPRMFDHPADVIHDRQQRWNPAGEFAGVRNIQIAQ